MPAETETKRTALTPVDCCVCGISFGLPKHYADARQEDHRTFYCPNGHNLAWSHQSEAEKAKAEAERLRGELAAARQDAKYQRERREAEQRRVIAFKGQLTRVKKRVAAGVCPCCHRTFQNLAAHMKGQHPSYAADAQTSS